MSELGHSILGNLKRGPTTHTDSLVDIAWNLKEEIKKLEAEYERICEDITPELHGLGVKSYVTPSGNKFSVSEIPESYGVDATIWPALEDSGVEWWEVFKEADKDKIDSLLREGRISGEIVKSHLIVKRKSYVRKQVSKAPKHELDAILADRADTGGG